LISSIIKCRFRGPVARKPALPWQPFCAPLVGGSSECHPPSMKLIGPPGTELRHILATYIMCPCDLHFWPISPKIGSRDHEVLLNVYAYFEVHRHFSFWNIRSQIVDLVSPLLDNRRCHGNNFVPHSLGVFLILASKYELDTTTQYWVITILSRYVTLRCDLWPLTFWPWSHVTWC